MTVREALAGLEPHECVVARHAARALGLTQAEQMRKLGEHRHVRAETAEDVVDQSGLPFKRRIKVLHAAVDYATARGWYEPSGYAATIKRRSA